MAEGLGPIGFLYNLIREGVGPTAGLRAYREAGGSIRTQRWFQAYGEVAAAVQRRPAVEGLSPGAVPGAEHISPITSRARPGYLYRVGVVNTQRGIITEQGTPGEDTVLDWVSVRSHRLLTPEEAQLEAEERIRSGYRSEAGLVTVLGSQLTEIMELRSPEEEI